MDMRYPGGVATFPVARQRPREHDGSSGSEALIFEASEELLTRSSLQDITVADILAKAGLSRANFYHYFASKYDVLAALLSKILEETYREDGPWQAEPGRLRARSLDSSMRGTVRMWSGHGAVICAAIENMYVVPQIAQAWAAMREQFVVAVAEQIEYERKAGRAPTGPPARTIATMLVCGVERTFYVGTRGLDPRLPTAEHAVESLTEFTAAGIFGTFRRPRRKGKAKKPDLQGLAALTELPAWASPADNETAAAILRGMGELLQEMPLDDVSVARICKQSGVSRATFYFYFGNKEACFAALFGQVVGQIVAGFVEGMISGEPDAMRQLASSWLSMPPLERAVIQTAVHEWPRRADVRDIYLDAASRIVSAIEAALGTTYAGDAQAQGELAASLFWTLERSVAGALAEEENLEDAQVVSQVLGDFLVTVMNVD